MDYGTVFKRILDWINCEFYRSLFSERGGRIVFKMRKVFVSALVMSLVGVAVTVLVISEKSVEVMIR